MKSRNSLSTLNLTLAAIALSLGMATTHASAQEGSRVLCYLDSFEAEADEESATSHEVEMEVRCAHEDRQVLDVADFDLQFLDGDADLLAAGAEWLEAYKERTGRSFFSSGGVNTIEVSETGRNRSVELTAHSNAVPQTGIARLTGTVDLIIEADCVGEGAIEPVTVELTAGALRAGEAVSLDGGGEIMATEQGTRGDTPMLAIGGAASYVALVEPPAGVIEYNFMGNKRIIVEADADDAAAVSVQVCPSEVIQVPVSIEAAI